MFAPMAAASLDIFDDVDGGRIGLAGPRVGPAHFTRRQEDAAWKEIEQRARHEAEARQMNLANRRAGVRNLPQNQFELAAFAADQNTPRNVGAALGANMLSSFMGYGRGLDALFNQGATTTRNRDGSVTTSGGSPYAQLQQAAVDTAPSRAARDIAQIQAAVDMDQNRSRRELAEKLVDSMFGGNFAGGMAPLTGMRTDYGAGVSMPRKPAHVNMARFRRPNPVDSLFA